MPDSIRTLLIILQSSWLLACVVLVFASLVKLYSDLGGKGWNVLIPFYGPFMLFKKASDGGTIFLLAIVFTGLAALLYFFFPFGIVYFIAPVICLFFLSLVMAKAYGKSNLFGVGLFFFPMVFYYNLAFDNEDKKAAAEVA